MTLLRRRSRSREGRPETTRRGRSVAAAACLGAVVLVMVGAVAGLALVPQPVPSSLAAGAPVTAAPVTYESFDDARRSTFTAVTRPGVDIAVMRAGTVTSSTCQAGASMSSGDVPLTVDATPVVALHTGYPLWRDLAAGDTGPDVAAVQAELARLGYAPGTSGVLDRSTRKALVAFFTDRGVSHPDGSLARASLLWLPSSELVVAACAVAPAEAVAPGQIIASSGERLVALQPAMAAVEATPGDRVLTVNGVSGPVGADGRVTDPAVLAAVEASADYAFAGLQAENGADSQLAFTTTLAAPLDTAVLPAAALFGVSGTSACLSSHGVVHPVTVVTSMLGSTYVTIDDGATPATVDLTSPADRTERAETCS